jgi:archaellum biogenesis ATPase FlaH
MRSTTVQSGIDVVDRSWGGLCLNEAHLLYGERRAGRDLLALHMARTALAAGDTCLFITARTRRELAAHASSIGFDLKQAHDGGHLRLVPVPCDLVAGEDSALAGTLFDLARFVDGAAPDWLIIDDLEPLIRFASVERLRRTLARFLDATKVTTVLALDEPDTVPAEELIAFLRGRVSGTIHLALDPVAASSTARRLSLLPGRASLKPEPMLAWDLASILEVTARSKPPTLEPPLVTSTTGDGTPQPLAAIDATLGATIQVDMQRGGGAVAQMPALVATRAEADSPESHEDLIIRFFDPRETLGATQEPADPLGPIDVASQLFSRGHYLEGKLEDDAVVATGADDEHTDRASSSTSPPCATGTAEQEHERPAAENRSPHRDTTWFESFFPAREAQPRTLPEQPHGPAAVDEFAAFVAAYEAAVAAQRTSGTPFLALALRMEPNDPAAVHFRSVVSALRRTAGPADMVLVDESLARVAMLLPGHRLDAAQTTFRNLKNTLREAGPSAEDALGAVSAIVVPNGDSFSTSSEFLAYVMAGA